MVWNANFKDRMDFYGVTPRLCRYYRAQTKGKVESGVKYVKRNALAGRRFRDLDELNAWLFEWCLEVADQRVHGTTHEQPAERFARAEAAALIRWSPPADAPRAGSDRIVPRDGYVALETNRYPVPLSWAGHTVGCIFWPRRSCLGSAGEEPVRHGRLVGKHQVARWSGPPRSSPAAQGAGRRGRHGSTRSTWPRRRRRGPASVAATRRWRRERLCRSRRSRSRCSGCG